MWSLLTDILITAVSGLLNIVLTVFYEYVLKLDTVTYVKYFPALSQGYRIFQVAGAGLVAVFAVLSLVEFLLPHSLGAPKQTDTAGGILFRTAIAGALVYGGNYILVWMLNAANEFYEYFIGIKLDLVVIDFATITSLITESVVFTFIPGLSQAAALLTLLLALLLLYNIFRMLLEVVERYFLVGVMIFTSPPFFAMYASGSLRPSFKSWVRMYVSGLFMLAVSVFFSKVVLSGLHFSGSFIDTAGRLIFTFAMCKIAQQTDTYLKQLGLGTAETGRSLMEDIVTAGKSVEFIRGKATGRTGKSAVLGANTPNYTAWRNTAAGRTFAGVKAGVQSNVSGGSSEDMSRAAAVQNIKENMPAADQTHADIRREEEKTGTAAEHMGRMTHAQTAANGTDIPSKKLDPEKNTAQTAAGTITAKYNEKPVSAAAMPQPASEKHTSGADGTKPAEAAENYKKFGAPEQAGKDGVTVSGLEGKPDVSARAKAGGVKFEPAATAENFAFSGAPEKADKEKDAAGNTPRDKINGVLSGNSKAVSDVTGSERDKPGRMITDGQGMKENDRNTPKWNEGKKNAEDISTGAENGSEELSGQLIRNPERVHNTSQSIRVPENENRGSGTENNMSLHSKADSAAVLEANSHILPPASEAEYSNVSTFNTRDTLRVNNGALLPGGHGWTATVTDRSDGSTATWVGLSEAAYNRLALRYRQGFRLDEKSRNTDHPQYVRKFVGTPGDNGSYRNFMNRNAADKLPGPVFRQTAGSTKTGTTDGKTEEREQNK